MICFDARDVVRNECATRIGRGYENSYENRTLVAQLGLIRLQKPTLLEAANKQQTKRSFVTRSHDVDGAHTVWLLTKILSVK